MAHNDHSGENGFAGFENAIRNPRIFSGTIIRKPLAIGLCTLGIIVLLAVLGLTVAAHHVDEGFVGVYYRGGALLEDTADPGYHFMIPFITTCKQVQITIQTDVVSDVPCGTSGGVIITFEKIEVVNLLQKEYVYDIVRNYTIDYDKPLIYNKVAHEINQFCSKHTIQEVYIDLFDTIDENLSSTLQKDLEVQAPGLSVQTVRVTKPHIPEEIEDNYVKMEAQKTELLVAEQTQKVVEKVAETEKKKALIEADKVRQVAVIKHNQTIAEKDMEKTVNTIQNEINLAKEKVAADADFYKTAKAAEANEKLLTDKFLEMKRIEAINNNNKIYYGDSIPKAFFNSEIGTAAAASVVSNTTRK